MKLSLGRVNLKNRLIKLAGGRERGFVNTSETLSSFRVTLESWTIRVSKIFNAFLQILESALVSQPSHHTQHAKSAHHTVDCRKPNRETSN